MMLNKGAEHGEYAPHHCKPESFGLFIQVGHAQQADRLFYEVAKVDSLKI